MSIIGGATGCVDGVAAVKKWSIFSKANLQASANSSTAGAEGNIAGNKDWNGSYEADGHTPAKLPGEKFTFTGSVDETTGVVGPAIVDKVEIKIDIANGTVISHTVTFSANGALVFGAAVATDATSPDLSGAVGCSVELGTVVAEPVFSALPNVKTVTISISAKNASTVNSSSAGQTLREAGNWSVSVSINVDINTMASIIAVNTIKALKVILADATFWLINWIIFGEASNINVDIETGAIIGCTYNAGLVVEQVVGETPTMGSIVTPAEDTIWPAA